MNESDGNKRILIAYNEPLTISHANDLDYISEAAVKNEAELVYQVLLKLGHLPSYLPITDVNQAIETVRQFQPEMIFNLCEGYRGNAKLEMNITGVWDLLNVPYTGNPAFCLGLSQNKVIAKKLFEANKIKTPEYQVYHEKPRETYLSYPLIAKPACEDASLGIFSNNSIIHDFNHLQERVQELLAKYQQPILVEKYIDGREFNIGILGSDPPKVLPVSEISFTALGKDEPHITSYEAKWLEDHPLYQKTPAVCPAPIDNDLKHRLESVAMAVYTALSGRDYGRVDTRVDEAGEIYVLEYNPNPDISADAGYVKALKAAGISYEEFLQVLITQTMKRKKHD
jgi:D-alanine-D-alanine ligase